VNARSATSRPPGPDLDTALVLGMASTALPFASSPRAEAERWLRILRLHGAAAAALQAVGVSEAPLEEAPLGPDLGTGEPESRRRERLAEVTELAGKGAAGRGAKQVDSGDVLVAVMRVYGRDFDRLLRLYGTDRDEVLEHLGTSPHELAEL
jgi:hypothetical protein